MGQIFKLPRIRPFRWWVYFFCTLKIDEAKAVYVSVDIYVWLSRFREFDAKYCDRRYRYSFLSSWDLLLRKTMFWISVFSCFHSAAAYTQPHSNLKSPERWLFEENQGKIEFGFSIPYPYSILFSMEDF